jgi:hypothetical protein
MWEEIKKIYHETYIFGNIILFLICIGCGIVFKDMDLYRAANFVGGLAFVLGFNLHDCIDYGRRFNKYNDIRAIIGNSLYVSIYQRSIAAYRIEQWIVMFILGGLMWSVISPWTVLWGFIMWQFCVADFFFYLVLKEPLTEMHYNWLENWSVIAAILKPVGRTKFYCMAITGLLLPLVWMIINLIRV